MSEDSGGLPPAFRKWSILAFLMECIVVVLAFLIFVVILKWKINETLLYILLIVMAVSAGLIIFTGRTAVDR